MNIKKKSVKTVIQLIAIVTILAGGWWLTIRKPAPVAYGNFPLGELWVFEADGFVRSISQTGENHLLVSTPKSVSLLDPATGYLYWKFPINNISDPRAGFGAIYAMDKNQMIALDEANAQIRWNYEFKDKSLSKNSFILSSYVLINTVSVDVFAIDPVTGQLQWSIPADRGPTMFYGDQEQIIAVRHDISVYGEDDGKLWWVADYPSILGSDYSNGILYYAQILSAAPSGTSGDCQVVALDMRDKRRLWENNLHGSRIPHVTVADELLLVSYHPNLYAFDLITGSLMWQTDVKYGLDPVASEDFVYILEGFSRKILAVDKHTGAIQGYLKTDRNTMAFVDREIVSASTKILFFAVGNKVYAYGK